MRIRSFIISTGLLCSSFSMKSQDTEGLVARYTFNDNNGLDDIGTNYARLSNVTPTADRFGNTDFAVYLLGNIDSYIDLGSSAALKPPKGSISLWARIQTVTYNGKGISGNPIIQARSHAGDDFNEAYSIGYNFDLEHLAVATSLSERYQAYVHTDKTTTLREWHHVVLTYDDEYLCFYLDGNFEGKVVKNFRSAFLEDDPVLVGICSDNKNERFFCGSVDDIEIYDRVLGPEEVAALYNAPNPNRYARLLNWILAFAGIFLFITLAVWSIRRYIAAAIKKEREKDKLRNHWYEQENRILKAQMNPHFIFNSLNTIQQFIIVNENTKAQVCLSKFSKLTRKLLESNTRDSISVKDEIELCESYLEVESIRFSSVFSYSIHINEGLDISNIHIPHFLIQVFIENAIWHGLLPKDGAKQIEIGFRRIDEQTLCCTIDDNGVGRKTPKPVEIPGEKTSLAIGFVQQRLSLYSRIKERDYGVDIIDKFNEAGQSEGTRAVLTIPILSN